MRCCSITHNLLGIVLHCQMCQYIQHTYSIKYKYMTPNQAFTALQWFCFKEGEVGCSEDDIITINSLLDIFQDCEDIIPSNGQTYKLFCSHYRDYFMPTIQ